MNKKIDKKTAFLGAPFANYMNPETGRLYEDKQIMITKIIELLVKKGYTVENSHLRENWGVDWMAPDVCTPLDYQKIKKSKVFVAIPGDPPSGGVHVELGWASALDTRVVMLLEKGKSYSNLTLGLGTVGTVDYVRYKTLDDCLKKLDKLV